jgi:uncharacterized DUF497 family protein
MILISDAVLEKLKEKHAVERVDVEHCFANLKGWFLEDRRSDHVRTLPTLWFIAETNKKRCLKVVFQDLGDEGLRVITAYEPNQHEKSIYATHGL